jgi:hypothetical protein
MNSEYSISPLADFEPMMLATPGDKTLDLVAVSQDVLFQGLGLLFDLWDRTYSRAANPPYNASIGQHYRHVLEHFQCAIRGARSREIDYHARERNVRLENEVTYASIATCDVLRAIKNYTEETLASQCNVVQSVAYGNTQAPTVASNLGRELAYCTGHAIHHYAIIRLICHNLGIHVPAEFGVAPSTIQNMSSLSTR